MKDKKLIAAMLSGSERYALLREVCCGLGAEVRAIGFEELGLTVDEVLDGEASSEGTCAEQELLLFSGFSGAELNEAVAALRQAGLYVPLKAVRTAQNGSWPLNALIDELNAEHEYMKQRKKAQASDPPEA